MKLTNFCEVICNRHRNSNVIKGWQNSLQEEFAPLRSYFRPLDQLAHFYPGKDQYESYRIVIHRDGSIVGVDDEDWDNRIQLTQSDIVLYEFNRDLFRDSLCAAFGLQPSKIPIPEMARIIHLGYWEPEKSARFPVDLLLPGAFNLRDKVFEQIVNKTEFAQILLVPSRNHWDGTLGDLAKKHNILLVPLDEVIWLEDGKICPTPLWPEYLTAFCQMVDISLPSRYRKVVRDYVFAQRDEEWFLQYGETKSALDLGSHGALFIQYLLKHPSQRIPIRELWGEIMGTGKKCKKAASEFEEMQSVFFDGDAVLDQEAAKNYRNRLLELSEYRIKAEDDNDFGALDRINTEFETIESALQSSRGLGGRSVKIGNENIKLGDRVRKLVNRALSMMRKRNPNMARFLKNSLTMGVYFEYKPSTEVSWKFE